MFGNTLLVWAISCEGAFAAVQEHVMINGLGRHMERQHMARKQKEEQQKREAEVFLLNPKSPRQLFTIPKPFKLAHNTQHQYRAARAEHDAVQDVLKECTFRPTTSVQTNRQLIKKILESED